MTREQIEREYNFVNGIVQRFGKFEGCAVYVPYFWDIGMNGGADEDNGATWTFYVTAEDKKIFPELKRRQTIKLTETEIGFVVEG